MSGVKHTPGPWEVEPEHSRTCFGGLESFIEDRPDAVVVNIPHPPFALGSCGAICLGENARPNAHLMAASPDLLKAAMDFVANVDRGEAQSTRSYAQFKAAILKAKGRA